MDSTYRYAVAYLKHRMVDLEQLLEIKEKRIREFEKERIKQTERKHPLTTDFLPNIVQSLGTHIFLL